MSDCQTAMLLSSVSDGGVEGVTYIRLKQLLDRLRLLCTYRSRCSACPSVNHQRCSTWIWNSRKAGGYSLKTCPRRGVLPPNPETFTHNLPAQIRGADHRTNAHKDYMAPKLSCVRTPIKLFSCRNSFFLRLSTHNVPSFWHQHVAPRVNQI